MNELRLLKLQTLIWIGKESTYDRGKGKKDRYVILSTLLASRFHQYLAELKPSKYLF